VDEERYHTPALSTNAPLPGSRRSTPEILLPTPAEAAHARVRISVSCGSLTGEPRGQRSDRQRHRL